VVVVVVTTIGDEKVVVGTVEEVVVDGTRGGEGVGDVLGGGGVEGEAGDRGGRRC